ncbi:hypothetical protein L226DRAFT_615466 [Lentinus tigrinus ALCF2SS1-7]|uniref:MYND-type domain-containing protein n=1 Tax=Lentinus tigrinus ALCF2SS1-6 TaxID=1328759 RepID=A0A5C2RZG0_9APHY|nr:hypothetical protein L227DRAFT_656252 [Lentinus tigrinus ALCF2SS1-6]RPD71439.1 hypothetical protein L226DRAFT_615466 [Lentinus tigrinus ALCF2SS1-7]
MNGLPADVLYEEMCMDLRGFPDDDPRPFIAQTCHYLGIPQALLSRSGLRMSHSLFPSFAQKLEQLFEVTCRNQDARILNAVIHIWRSICVDADLCQQLLERGLLNRIKLISLPETRSRLGIDAHMEPVYQILALAACYGDHTSKQEVLFISLRIFSRFTSRPFLEMTLKHLASLIPAVSHTLYAEDNPQKLLPSGLLAAVDVVMELLPTDRPPHDLILHGLSLLLSACSLCSWQSMKEKTAALDLIAALLRSEDVALRVVSVWAYLLLRDFKKVGPLVNMSPAIPLRLERLPPALRQVVEDYGPDKCEASQVIRCRQLVLGIVRRLSHHRDHRKFGTEMVAFLTEHGRHLDIVMAGYASWKGAPCAVARHLSAALSTAVKVLRGRGDSSRADTLHLEHLYLTAREGASQYAKVVLARDPRDLWAHLVLCDANEGDIDGLIRTCRRALLELPRLPLDSRQRLQKSLMIALMQKAFVYLAGAAPSEEHKRAVGVRCLEDALELADTYVSQAPPDLPSLLWTLDYRIFITLILRGPKSGLKSIQPSLRMYKRIKCIQHLLRGPPPQRPGPTARELLLDHYRSGINTWDGLIKRFDALNKQLRTPTNRHVSSWGADSLVDATDDLGVVDWSNFCLGSTAAGALRCTCHCETRSRVRMGEGCAALSRCASCGKTTAMLKRCGRCSKAWYCDITCQTAHWPEHKKHCKRK